MKSVPHDLDDLGEFRGSFAVRVGRQAECKSQRLDQFGLQYHGRSCFFTDDVYATQ
jgi:hypothetical protein